MFVKNWWFLGNIPYVLYLTGLVKWYFSVRYKTYGILPRNHQFLTKISDFVKLFESSREIHFGVLWTFWGLRNHFQSWKYQKNKEYHFSHIFPKGRKVPFYQAGEVQNVWNITKKSSVFNKNFRFRETIRELSKNPFGSPMDVLGAQKSLLNINMHESLS